MIFLDSYFLHAHRLYLFPFLFKIFRYFGRSMKRDYIYFYFVFSWPAPSFWLHNDTASISISFLHRRHLVFSAAFSLGLWWPFASSVSPAPSIPSLASASSGLQATTVYQCDLLASNIWSLASGAWSLACGSAPGSQAAETDVWPRGCWLFHDFLRC